MASRTPPGVNNTVPVVRLKGDHGNSHTPNANATTSNPQTASARAPEYTPVLPQFMGEDVLSQMLMQEDGEPNLDHVTRLIMSQCGDTDHLGTITEEDTATAIRSTEDARQAVVRQRVLQFEKCLNSLFATLNEAFPNSTQLSSTIERCLSVIQAAGHANRIKGLTEIAVEWRKTFKPYMIKVVNKKLELEDIISLCKANPMFESLQLTKLWPELKLLSEKQLQHAASTNVKSGRNGKKPKAKPVITAMDKLYFTVRTANRVATTIYRLTLPAFIETSSVVLSALSGQSNVSLASVMPIMIQKLIDQSKSSNIYYLVMIVITLALRQIDILVAQNITSAEEQYTRVEGEMSQINLIIGIFAAIFDPAIQQDLEHFTASFFSADMIAKMGQPPENCIYVSEDELDDASDTMGRQGIMTADDMNNVDY